jgi:hypothetical protein
MADKISGGGGTNPPGSRLSAEAEAHARGLLRAVYRKRVQAAVNRIANPLISQVANQWEQAIRAADAQRR